MFQDFARVWTPTLTSRELRGAPVPITLDAGNRKILEQDRAVVESSQPAEVPPPAEERSVETDLPTLRFRRYYLRHLKGFAADGPARRAEV